LPLHTALSLIARTSGDNKHFNSVENEKHATIHRRPKEYIVCSRTHDSISPKGSKDRQRGFHALGGPGAPGQIMKQNDVEQQSARSFQANRNPKSHIYPENLSGRPPISGVRKHELVAPQRRSTFDHPHTTMHRRINILHLTANALILATYAGRRVCARSAWSSNGHHRPQGYAQSSAAAGYQRRQESPGHSGGDGLLSPRKFRLERSTAAVPWLALASGLRGGASAAEERRSGIRHSAAVSTLGSRMIDSVGGSMIVAQWQSRLYHKWLR